MSGARKAMSRAILAAFAVLAGLPVMAQDARIAVAANFTVAAEELKTAFVAKTGFDIALSFGATGTLFAQITQGAPFDALIAADSETVSRLVEAGSGVAASRFTYAVGTLVLYSAIAGAVTGPESLKGGFRHFAIAEPRTAPYGAAAIEVLRALGLTEIMRPKLVTGQNISQTHQFIETGNAELGFVALSQIFAHEGGSRWVVDEDLHEPIAQDAILISPGNEAAKAFLDFLKSDTGIAIIEGHGYRVAG